MFGTEVEFVDVFLQEVNLSTFLFFFVRSLHLLFFSFYDGFVLYVLFLFFG